MRKLALALFLLLLCGSSARASTVYYAKTAAGSANGTDCADAFALPGSLAVSAGNIYMYCGTGTYAAGTSAAVTLTGGGASGNPAIFRFAHSAVMQAPYWGQNGAIRIAANYITVDGSPTGTPCGYISGVDTACDGTIQATANGASLANHVAGGKGVWINGSLTGDVVQNVNFQNLFVPGSGGNPNNETTGSFSGNTMCVYVDFTSQKITIQNNVCNKTHSLVRIGYQGTSGNTFIIQNNVFSNTGEGIWIGAGGANSSIDSGGTISKISGNDFSNLTFDTVAFPPCHGSGANHQEFIHLFTQQTNSQIGTSGAPFQIAGNYFHGLTGCSFTSEIYIECDSAGQCGAPNHLFVDIINNVIVSEDPNSALALNAGGNGMSECEGSTCRYVNDTYYSDVGHGSSSNFAQHCESGSILLLQNNIFDGMNAAFVPSGCGTVTTKTNLGFGLASACGTTCTLSANPLLNTGSTPPYQLTSSSSGAYQAGINGTSLGITALDSDALGVARPPVGNWDLGAFSLGGTSPGISFTPTSLTFASQIQGTTSAPQSITVKNTGTATLLISSVTITGTNSGDFGQTNNCGGGVSAGGSCSISVTFTPSATGARSASVSVADNAAGSPQTVGLSGTGSAATAGTSFSPTSLAFGSQVILTTSAGMTTTLTNTGSGTLTVSSVAITGTNNTDFAQTNTCVGSVAPSGTCTITATFRPTATGARSASISVTDNATGSPQTVPLTGTGTAAAVSLSPASLTFASQTTGTTSAAQSVTLTNTGSATLTISSITLTGTNSGDFAQTNNCASSVAIGGSCVINVKFTPSAGGSRSASVSIADSAVGSPQTVALTGTGVSTAPAVTFSQPSGLGFGNVIVNNPVLVVQHIKNTGSATLTISSYTVGGTNAGMFTTHTTCGATLAVGFSCEISVVFIPTSIGTKSATVSVADNAANSPQVFSVTGTGVTGTSPTLDQYGGVIASPCATLTGRFHVEQVGSQWTYCTPLGNEFYLLGVYIVDYAGNAGYQAKITAKYGSPTAWAVPTLQRIQSWGFNSPYYTSSMLVRPFATDPSYPLDANGLRSLPIKMPFELVLRPGLYGMRNPQFNATAQFPTGQMLPIGSTVKNMAAGWTPVYYVPGNFVPPTGEADYYDPNLTTFSNNFLSSQEVGPTTSPYSDYVIGFAYDDGDQVFGFGAGPDFATTPVGHNNPNLGWLTATMTPTQVVSSLYPAVYTNTQVYTKAAWQTYLTGKYGTIGALNTAWGSTYTTFGSSGTNFTGEAVGTGNGTTATFTHTLAHLTPTPFTVQVLINGVVIGGDLGHGSTGTLFGCSPAVTPTTTMSGTLVYSTGALSVTFVTPPPNGATITVNYQQNGWQVGTGIMDEDGRTAHQAWLSGNAFTLSGANANTATDLNAFFAQMASTYLGIGHTALAANLPGYLFLGPDSLGSWQAPPARQVLQAVPGNVDVYVGPMQQAGSPNYQAKLDFIETWAGNIPQENGSYLHANPDSPYSSNPVTGDYTTQFLKGQAYANLFVSTKTATYTANSVHPFIALNHFDFLDISSEQTNWGLVTLLDNAYDGNEATTGTVTCSAPLQAYTCGGEAATYGNYISCVAQANFTDTVCSGTGTPTVSLSTSSLSFGNQTIGTASNPQVVIVSNTGTGALNISSVAITGANTGDFGQNNTCSLPVGPSASCTISVVFTPTAGGSRSASVTITDNASGSPHSVTLSGTGIAGPVIGPNPAMFSWYKHDAPQEPSASDFRFR